ncbi:MAG: NADH:ubiquinone oxidoreductase subunit NDUFA12 [Magnetospirillum sp. WYHS-4]
MIVGTLFYTWIFGRLEGTDEFGNRYFRSSHKRHGTERRWVLYKGDPEASKVPPEWHAWLHHTVPQPLTEIAANPRPWQKPHQSNPTGTRAAYRPQGHDLVGGSTGSGAYEAWQPDAQ